MNPNADPQRTIVVLTIITLASTVGATLKQPPKAKIDPSRIHRYIFGGFAAMFVASVIADFDPKLGVSLAGIAAGGAFFVYGLPTIISYFPEQEAKEAKEAKQKKPATTIQPQPGSPLNINPPARIELRRV